MSISSCCDSLPSRVLRYSIIQLSVQIRQRHIWPVVTIHLGASGVLVDADGVIVLVIWIKSSHLAPNRNLNPCVMRIRCLWRLSLIVRPWGKPIFERLKLGTIQWIIQSVKVLKTFICSKFSSLISNPFTVRWAICLPRNLLSKDWSSFGVCLLFICALLVFLTEVNREGIILTWEFILIFKISLLI